MNSQAEGHIVNEEEIRKKQKEDLERILALALIKNLYNQGKISEYVYRKIKSDTEKKVDVENRRFL